MCTLYPLPRAAVQQALPRKVTKQLEHARALARAGHELSAATAYRHAVPMLRGVCVVLKQAVREWRETAIRYGIAQDDGSRVNVFERYEELYLAEGALVAWSRDAVIG